VVAEVAHRDEAGIVGRQALVTLEALHLKMPQRARRNHFHGAISAHVEVLADPDFAERPPVEAPQELKGTKDLGRRYPHQVPATRAPEGGAWRAFPWRRKVGVAMGASERGGGHDVTLWAPGEREMPASMIRP